MENGLIALDIGAGTTSFGKDLRKLNPQIKQVLCAEPCWRGSANDILQKGKSGVFKVLGHYEKMDVPDGSIDILSLNSPHPLIMPGRNFRNEVMRVLKSGGIFYYGHSTNIHTTFPEESMQFLGEGAFHIRTRNNILLQILLGVKKEGYEHKIPETDIRIVPSPVIFSNMQEMWMRFYKPQYASGSSSYVYNSTKLFPNWKAWRKL